MLLVSTSITLGHLHSRHSSSISEANIYYQTLLKFHSQDTPIFERSEPSTERGIL